MPSYVFGSYCKQGRAFVDAEFACVRRAIQKVYAMGDFPMPGLAELRDKYTSLGAELANVACLAGMFPSSPLRESRRIYSTFGSP